MHKNSLDSRVCDSFKTASTFTKNRHPMFQYMNIVCITDKATCGRYITKCKVHKRATVPCHIQSKPCFCLIWAIKGVKKSSLFPLTSPKKLGTVDWHNFFFLINFFFLFTKKVTHFYIANMFIFVIFTLTG